MNDLNKYKLYLQAFNNVIKKRKNGMYNKKLMKQNIFYLIKVINLKPEAIGYEELYSDFELHTVLKQTIEMITPAEFMQLFPIKKEYDGEKYGMKDYFYTMDYINTLDHDENIQDALSFIMEYNNIEIHELCVAMMLNLSNLRRYEGKRSLAEEWADTNGIQTLRKHTDNAGNDFLIDKQGRTTKVNKPKPKHLKLVH